MCKAKAVAELREEIHDATSVHAWQVKIAKILRKHEDGGEICSSVIEQITVEFITLFAKIERIENGLRVLQKYHEVEEQVDFSKEAIKNAERN